MLIHRNKLKNAQAEEPTMLGSIREGRAQSKTLPPGLERRKEQTGSTKLIITKLKDAQRYSTAEWMKQKQKSASRETKQLKAFR